MKLDGTDRVRPLSDAEKGERRAWQLSSEMAAIDRFTDAWGVPLGGAASTGPGMEALSSKGLVALAAGRRAAEEAAAAAAGAEGVEGAATEGVAAEPPEPPAASAA